MQPSVWPSQWCITRRDLEVFEDEVRSLYNAGGIPDDPARPNPFHDHPDVGPNMYRVNECYIKPVTLALGTSWALMRNPQGLPCDVFVSHCWSEGVFEFVKKIKRLWPRGAKHLYCCFLSNPQNGDIRSMLGDNPGESPFAKALETAKYVLVVPNQHQSLYSRLWCVFEMDMALQRSLIIRLPWQINARRFVLVATTCCVSFSCGASVCFLLAHRSASWSPTGYQVTSIAIVLGLRTLWTYLPWLCYWATFLVLGGLAGFVADMIIHGRSREHDIPIPDRVPVLDATLVTVVLACDCVQRVGRRLITEAVSKEGGQIEDDTIRNAAATDVRDEVLIRAAIRGREDEIDRSILVLKSIGRYDKAVRCNIDSGMSLEHAQQGFQSCLFLGGIYLWFIPLLEPLQLQGPWIMTPTKSRLTFFLLLTMIVAVVSICLEVLSLDFYKDYAAYATRAFFWAAVVRHMAVGMLTTFVPTASDLHKSLRDGGALNYAIFSICFVIAVVALTRFHCHKRKAASQDTVLHDDTESSSDSATPS